MVAALMVAPFRVRIEEGWCADDYGGDYRCEKIIRDDHGDMITSYLQRDGMHIPLLDLDFAADLRPSKTPGQYHLVLYKPMKWRKYKRLLRAMVRAGLIERDWYQLVKNRRQALLADPFDD